MVGFNGSRCQGDGVSFIDVRAPGSLWAESILSNGLFQGANLQGANFHSAWLRNVDFTGADLRRADFRGAALDEALMNGAELEGARYDWRSRLPFTRDEAHARGMVGP